MRSTSEARSKVAKAGGTANSVLPAVVVVIVHEVQRTRLEWRKRILGETLIGVWSKTRRKKRARRWRPAGSRITGCDEEAGGTPAIPGLGRSTLSAHPSI